MNTKTPNMRASLFAASAFNRMLFAGACFSLAAMASAQTTTPGDTDESTLKLSVFSVSTNKDVGYRAANSVSATRVDTAIKDLPFSVSAFTSQFIKDTNSLDLFDVVRYSAGVSDASREFTSGGTLFAIRGFTQTPQHDGFFSSPQSDLYVDTATVERVEVVKGPASLLYGEISPGGTVNYITKRAEAKPFVNVTAQVGSYNFARTAIDVNQPIIGKKLLFRFNGAWENEIQYQKYSKAKRWVIDPTVTWNITKNLQLKLNYQWFERKETPPAMFLPNVEVTSPTSVVASFASPYPATAAALTNDPSLNGAPGLGPTGQTLNGKSINFAPTVDVGFLTAYPGLAKTFNIVSKKDYRDTDLESLNGELDSKFGDHWVGRSNFIYAWNRSVQLNTGFAAASLAPPGSLVWTAPTVPGTQGSWAPSNAWKALSAAQQATAEYVFAQQINANPSAALQGQVDSLGNPVGNPAVIYRRSRWIESSGHDSSVAGDLAGHYSFGWGTLKPVVGFLYDSQYEYTFTRQTTGTAAAPNSRVWDVDPNSPSYYQNPNDFIPVSTVIGEIPNVVATSSLSFTTDEAVYGLMNGSFLHDRLDITGGVRYNRSSEQTTNLVPGTLPSLQSPGAKDIHDLTPQLGGGYKITKDVMAYVSYSESYQLATQSSLRVNSNPMFPAPPTTAKGYEAGIKTDLFNGRVSSTLAVYRIDQKNAVLTLNGFTASGATASTDFESSVRSQGIEYELTYSPMDNLQIFGSVAEDDIRVRSFSDPNPLDPPGLYNILLGEHPQGTTKTLGNVWTRYSFTNNTLKGLWIGGGFNYNGKELADNRNPYFFIPSYFLWNSAVGYDWTWHRIGWSTTINWNNMTNKQYIPANQETGLPERIEFTVAAKF
jgi:iron complex outermembrane receptor protein